MLKIKQHKFIWLGIIVLGVILIGMPAVYAGDVQPLPDPSADEARLNAEQDFRTALEEIAANREGFIEELVSTWYNDLPGWEDDFRSALNLANDSKLLAVREAGSYNEVQAILGGGISADYSDGSMPKSPVLGSENYDFVYAPVNPCRIIDTRNAGGIIGSGGTRSFRVHGAVSGQGGNSGGCDAPRGEPRAVHINIVAVDSTDNGFLTVWPAYTTRPLAGVLNYSPTARTDPISNAFTVKSAFALGYDISVYAYKQTHVVADVMGYYYDAEPEKITALNGQRSTSTLTVGTSYTTLVSKTVSVPYSGGIMITGSASFSGTSVDSITCKFTENGTYIDWWSFGGIYGTQHYHTSRTIARPVTQGTKIYALQCYQSGGTSVLAHNRTLTMLFVKEGM